MLRPLENDTINKFFYFKVFFLLFLIGVSLYGNYHFYVKKNENLEVLSTNKENKKLHLSVDEILNQGKKTVNNLKQKGEDLAGQVLGVLEDKVVQIASQSTQTVSNFVFDSTLDNFLQQIERLPESQREKIKNKICKP